MVAAQPLVSQQNDVQEFADGQTLSEVSSVMKFHMPLRTICIVQAETEGDTLCLFVLFVISVNIRLILCSKFIAKNLLQVTSE